MCSWRLDRIGPEVSHCQTHVWTVQGYAARSGTAPDSPDLLGKLMMRKLDLDTAFLIAIKPDISATLLWVRLRSFIPIGCEPLMPCSHWSFLGV